MKFPEQTEIVDIASIQPDPENAREHSQENLDAIRSSLRKFGQQTPIIVDGNGLVRKGNGTLAAAQAEGWTQIAIIRTELQGNEAAAYAIIDNRTTDMSQFAPEKLSATIGVLHEDDPSLLDFTCKPAPRCRQGCEEVGTVAASG